MNQTMNNMIVINHDLLLLLLLLLRNLVILLNVKGILNQVDLTLYENLSFLYICLFIAVGCTICFTTT